MRTLRLALASLVGAAVAIAHAPLDAQSIAIIGGTVHQVSSPPIENGMIVIRDGRIVAVGPAATMRPPGDATIVSTEGKVITPGFIEASTQLGLTEVGSVGSTSDGSLNDGANRAHFMVSDGINPRSMLFAEARINGVTNAITAPGGGVISGQGAALTLLGTTRGDVLLDRSVALYATLGPDASGSAGGSRAGVVMELRDALRDARQEADDQAEAERRAEVGVDETPDPLDPEVAPLVAVLEGEIPLVIRASGTPDIEMALELQEEFGFRLVIEGGEEAWLLADRLAERGVPVIMEALENRPTQFHRLATRYEGAAILSAAGVPVILSTRSSHRVANVTHEAGNAIRYGMDPEAALRAVTIEPARAFGLDADLGTIEAGKVANLVVWSDDPFDFSGYAERVFIGGEEIEMDSRQRRLFERYRRTP
ncbi:MAG: amidohydrolase family protein [Gemmatimonadota bacterium]|nr:amidohydrolase family protein [Gemmatimonadota bacterium]